MRHASATLLVANGLLLASSAAHAVCTYTSSSSADVIYIGCRGGVTAICDDGVHTQVEADCTLSADVIVCAGGGNDTVTVVRSSITPTCNGTPSSITALTYNGRFVDVEGGAGDDTIEGGTGDHRVTGGDGADRVTAYSIVGFAAGDAGTDIVRAETAAGGSEVYGDSGHDCVSVGLGDPNGLPDIFNCGSDDDDYVNVVGFTETACETAVSSCN